MRPSRLFANLTFLVSATLALACATALPSETDITTPPRSPAPHPSATRPADSDPPPAATGGLASPTANDAARRNLENLLLMLDVVHPDPFHGIPRAEWVAELDDLGARLDALEPFEAQVELQRIVALLSRNGRDGHQWALPLDAVEAPALPLRAYEFEEGLFITEAMPPYEHLAGRRIVGIGEHRLADVMAAVEPLVPRDGPATVPGFRPSFMLRTSVLRGLGLIGAGDVRLTLEDGNGRSHEVDVAPMPFAEWAEWAGDFGRVTLPTRDDIIYLSRPGPRLWSELLDPGGTYYIRYEMVGPIASADIEAMRAEATAPSVERVVLDLRHNPGGDNGSYPPLLAMLSDPAIDRAGHLFVLTDRLTFSAASNLATELEQQTSAIFVGEPMGGGLNFWSDVTWVTLPDYPVRMRVGVSTRYWQKSATDDPRLTIEPDIPIALRAADYFGGRDAVFEALPAN